ncbi:MAG: DUF2975 domain-containing protein [Clostridia bacterium]|nr:DUF2975 domain-containing protein [Clostridia bacterium]
MLRIPKKYSLYLSMVLSIIFFIGCVVGAIGMPALAETLIDVKGAPLAHADFTLVLVLAYLILLSVSLADGLLFWLLMRVRRGLVFTRTSTDLVRGISWCCMLLGALCFGMGWYFRLSLVLAFAALLLGICLRVVKNVLEEASEIKSENELTI